MIKKEQGVIICQGDGDLLINPQNGEVVWATVCSAWGQWHKQHGYISVCFLEGSLNLDNYEVPLPPCEECDSYEECRACVQGENEEPDPTDCSAVDADATAASILAALAQLSDDAKKELLCM